MKVAATEGKLQLVGGTRLVMVEPVRWRDRNHRLRLISSTNRRRGPQVPHGTLTRWLEGCDCDRCREAQNDAARARGRARAQKRLPVEVRQQLLDAMYGGQPFRMALPDLGLTSNQVWGLTKTDEEWSATLDAALIATRRDDLKHGTNAAYVAGCVCKECRDYQQVRMGRSRD